MSGLQMGPLPARVATDFLADISLREALQVLDEELIRLPVHLRMLGFDKKDSFTQEQYQTFISGQGQNGSEMPQMHSS